MTKNDTLQKALIHIDKLQHQVDSLQQLQSYKTEVLQQRLEQASETVSNLSSLSTGFGTMYTVIGIIVAVLTLGIGIVLVIVPMWLGNKTDRAIQTLQEDFNLKIATLNTQHNFLQSKIRDENLVLSENFSREFDQLKNMFESNLRSLEEKTSKLKTEYLAATMRIEANFFSVSSDLFHHRGSLFLASAFMMRAACINNRNDDPSLTKNNLRTFNDTFKNFNRGEVEEMLKAFDSISHRNFTDCLTDFKDAIFTEVIEEISKHLELNTKKTEQ